MSLTDSGSGPRRSPAVSRSTASARPLWLYDDDDDGIPAGRGICPVRVRFRRGDPVDHRDRVRCRGRVVLEDLPCLVCGGRRVDPHAAMQVRPERMELEFERGDDPEVPTGAADAPEELGLLSLACPDEPAIGRDELDRPKAVDGEPELPLETADPATEREAGDTRVADDADRADEPMRLGGDIELAEEGTAVRPRGPRATDRP